MPPLWSLTASDLAAGYAAGRFTPSDALNAVLARLDAVNPLVNAMVAVDRGGAGLAAAQASERWKAGKPLSLLDGVPVSVKDNLHLHGMPASWGSRLYAGFMPDRDEPAIARLRRAGCVLFGKTNVPEFTMQGYTSNLLFGTTRNPHALDRTPGGSTGGGAAAVAAGIGPVAIGTDGGGSLRRPAAHCGLFALKPSVGQVARYDGFPQLMSDFEVIGPVARSAEDLAAVYDVLAGYDPADPRSLMAEASLPPWPRAPRLAFLPHIGNSPVDPHIAAAVERIVDELRQAGASVETIEAPFDASAVATAWSTIAAAGLAWHLAQHSGWQDRVTDSVRAMAEDGGRRTTADMLDALAMVGQVRQAAAGLFGAFDLLLCPTTAALAWPADEVFPAEIDGRTVGPRGHAVFTGWMNVAGLPALSVPISMTEAGGGIGLQVVAAHGRDRDLLAWLRKSPVLARFSPAPLAAMIQYSEAST